LCAYLQLLSLQLQHLRKAAAPQARMQVQNQQHRPATGSSMRLADGSSLARQGRLALLRQLWWHDACPVVLVVAAAACFAYIRVAAAA
jgi:hypothetical protein